MIINFEPIPKILYVLLHDVCSPKIDQKTVQNSLFGNFMQFFEISLFTSDLWGEGVVEYEVVPDFVMVIDMMHQSMKKCLNL